jgi:hypothetical protein
VHIRGDLTRSMKAGDDVTLAGVFLPEPFTGWRAMRAGLLTSTYLEVQSVRQMRAVYSAEDVSPEQYQAIADLGAQGQVFERLAASIAPEIYGHRDVKKVLLLQVRPGGGAHQGRGGLILGATSLWLHCMLGAGHRHMTVVASHVGGWASPRDCCSWGVSLLALYDKHVSHGARRWWAAAHAASRTA